MSDLKMSDVFHGDVWFCDNGAFRDQTGAKSDWRDTERPAICTAINAYDSNQEIIVKQAEQIEKLEKGKVKLYKAIHLLCCEDGIIDIPEVRELIIAATAKG